MRLLSWLLPLLLVMPLAWFGLTQDAESCIRFKKPGGSVDPGQRDPEDAPSETPHDEPEDEPTDVPDTPDAPPGAPPPKAPTTPPPTALPPTTPGGGGTARRAASDDSTWETWWELNRIEFFPRRWVKREITPEEGQILKAGPQPLHPQRVQDKLWPMLLKTKDHKHVFVQESALITMGRVAANEEQRAEARKILEQKIKHKDHLIARAAALGLFYVADETSVWPMYEVAKNPKADEDVRAFLALTLTNLKSSMAPTLLQELADIREGYHELVAAAIMGLGYAAEPGDPAIPAFLEDIAFKKKNVRREFRALAVESFGRIGSLEVGADPLLKGLADRDVNVRRSATIALGVLDYRTEAERKIEAIEAPYDEYIGVPMKPEDETRIQVLQGEIEGQRRAMAKSVKTIVKKLGLALQRDNDVFVQRMAAISLGRIQMQHPQGLAVRFLKDALKKNRIGNREYAIIALALAGDEETPTLATKLLDGNRNPSTRGACAVALGLFGDPDRENACAEDVRKTCDQTLQKMMRSDRNPVIRGYASLALGLVGNAKSGERILSMIKTTGTPTPRAYGALGLALLGTQQGANEIVGFLKSKAMRNGFVASHMVYALGLTKDRRPATFDSLLETAMDDSDRYVQAATIAAIGYLSSGEFYPRRHLMARGYNYMLGMDYIDTYFYKL